MSEFHTLYFVRPEDNAASKIESSDPGHPAPDGFVACTRDTYDAALAHCRAAKQAGIEALQDSDERRQNGDYQALLGVGLPEDVARRMAGYMGDVIG